MISRRDGGSLYGTTPSRSPIDPDETPDIVSEAAGPSRASVGAARSVSTRSDAAAARCGTGARCARSPEPLEPSLARSGMPHPGTLAGPTCSGDGIARGGLPVMPGSIRHRMVAFDPDEARPATRITRPHSPSRACGSSRVREGLPRLRSASSLRSRGWPHDSDRPAPRRAPCASAPSSSDPDVCCRYAGAFVSSEEAEPRSPRAASRSTVSRYASGRRGQRRFSPRCDRRTG